MAAIAITRGRENTKPGRRVFRGLGTWNSTDTTGTLQVPAGNIINARFISVQATSTAVAYSLDMAVTNGMITPAAGLITVRRSAGTDSAGTMFFEIEYDSQ